MVIIGVVLMIQGCGNALARAIWGTGWGLLSVAERSTDLPSWTGLAVGMLGLVLTVAAWLKRKIA
jgi:hypothetical protein